MDQKLVFVDLETGGIDCERHPIIQIAAIATDETLSPVEAFEVKVAFNKKQANRQSLRKNHYHPGTWAAEALAPRTAAREFASFLRRHASVTRLSAKGDSFRVAQLVAHNAPFDSAFLATWFQKLRLYLPASHIWLCTVQRALWHFSEQPQATRPRDMKLATLCHYFGVPFHAAQAHEALADVTATLGLYQALRQASANSLSPSRSDSMIHSTPEAAAV